jgi:two-component system NtrC family sensor kinase
MVRTRVENGEAFITIADTGRGMTPEQQAHAFEAGYTTKPVGEGTGMGLAIAKEIVEERHRGTIGVRSEPGAGTTFEIRIPLRQSRSAGQ